MTPSCPWWERNVLVNCMLECEMYHTMAHPSCLPDVGVNGRVRGRGGIKLVDLSKLCYKFSCQEGQGGN